jgi:hypothetical protein
MTDNLEMLCNHPNRMEAEMTRSILESYGITAVVTSKSKTKNPVLGMAGPLGDSFDVKVPAEDMERARELLDSHVSGEDHAQAEPPQE